MKTLILIHFLISALALTTAYAQQPVSGFDYLMPEMQEMQLDDFGNPGMLTVDAGEILFSTTGENGKSCASCHGDDGSKLDIKNIASYPVYSADLKKPLTLRAQILLCQDERIGSPALKHSSAEALQLEAFVRRLALGETVNVDVSGEMSRKPPNT